MSKIETIRVKIKKLFPASTVGGTIYFKEKDRKELKAVLEDMLDELAESRPNLTETAGKRICDECGGKFGQSCYHMGLSKAPDPLRVRVAKALEYEVYFAKGAWFWSKVEKGTAGSGGIPDYPNDLVAAMGAMEEYCKRKHNFTIAHYPDYSKVFRVSIWGEAKCGEQYNHKEVVDGNLPQAICEAIVSHSEQK